MTISQLLGLLIGLGLGAVFTWRHRGGDRTTRGMLIRVAVLMCALAAVRLLLPAAHPGWITGGLFMGLFIPMAWRLRRAAQAR